MVGITLVYYLVLSGQPDVLQKTLVGNFEGNNALQGVSDAHYPPIDAYELKKELLEYRVILIHIIRYL